MTEKRYYQKDFEELYYIFDSKTLSEKEFDERIEYDGYSVFADSLTGQEIVELLNELSTENRQLKQENEQLKSTLYYLLNVIQNKCSEYYPKCKEIVRSCFGNDSTNSRNDFNNIENDGDGE